MLRASIQTFGAALIIATFGCSGSSPSDLDHAGDAGVSNGGNAPAGGASASAATGGVGAGGAAPIGGAGGTLSASGAGGLVAGAAGIIDSTGGAAAQSGMGGSAQTGGSAGLGGGDGIGGARAATGKDYYCDPVNGLPTNAGTAGSPWRRLEEVFAAKKTFADGDVIHLRTGNHGSPVLTDGIASGQRWIVADTGAAPVLKQIRFAAGATRWTVDGVLVSPQEADGSSSTANLVQFDTGATNDTFQNSRVRYAPDEVAQTWDNTGWLNSTGIAIYVIGSDNQVLNNQIRNTHNGIMLERTSTAGAGATGSLVRGNSVIHFWEDAYRGKVSNCVFEYNSAINSYAVVPPGTESDPPHRDMFQSYRGDGSFTSVDNVTLRGNVFIARQGVRYTKVPFQYQGHYTIQGLSAFDGPYSGWTIENNVILVEVGLAMGLYGMDNSKIVNNTVVPDSYATDSEIRLTDRKDGTHSSGNTVRNNLVHTLDIGAAVDTAASNNVIVSSGYTSFFLNYPAGDVHLKAGSPAIGAGTTTDAPDIDADRAERTAPYDAGAYQFQVNSP